ncbi:translation elongation factor Ts [Limoniibacter endophyticus]|uniref:Elongation factor Ts n=1 Tax=Limoniibacter endophyticus TaxID=1565040 RepID=A0A8J3DKW5_9HYPH|nr:translation elongation factor Ts [Limoniibacter endophyticus]GHC62113.1 elongation factor Ts [Limoniibacter endophyticus]
MSFTAADVKKLREATGAGMMDCKTALTENNGDFDAATDWLRAKGIAKADKKADRTAAEGLVAVASDAGSAVIVEVNCETDFAARNEQFQALVKEIAGAALATDGSTDAVAAATIASTGQSVTETVKDAVGTIGENITFRRSAKLSAGVVSSYVHNAAAPNLGKLAVLVALETEGDKAAANEFGRKVAMHVASMNPLALNPDEVDPVAAEREKAIFTEQARESGKPENVIEKMIEGRMRKFFEEVALVKQAFVLNPDQTVEQAAKEAGVTITGFARILVGEGIEKEESDFAAEVAAAAKG